MLPRNFYKRQENLWRFLFFGWDVFSFWLSMCNGGKIFCICFLFLVQWNKEHFVLEIFKENLLALNQVATFLSSSFIVSKRFSIWESEINKFVSSANIIGVSLLELRKSSFMYMKKKIGPWLEPCGTPQIILQHLLFSYLQSDTNCCRCFKNPLNQFWHLPFILQSSNLCNKILWLTVSKAFDRSIKTTKVSWPFPNDVNMSSVRLKIPWCVELFT